MGKTAKSRVLFFELQLQRSGGTLLYSSKVVRSYFEYLTSTGMEIPLWLADN